jgi:hypothetical protein
MRRIHQSAVPMQHMEIRGTAAGTLEVAQSLERSNNEIEGSSGREHLPAPPAIKAER